MYLLLFLKIGDITPVHRDSGYIPVLTLNNFNTNGYMMSKLLLNNSPIILSIPHALLHLSFFTTSSTSSQ